VCLELGIDDPEAWLDSIPERVFDVWWSYYQCEPFGSHWERTASLATLISANTSLLAATRGVKTEPFGVLDFMPSDSLTWQKRKQRMARGIRSPQAQAAIIKQTFGFQA
jgi:hypothetical protein